MELLEEGVGSTKVTAVADVSRSESGNCNWGCWSCWGCWDSADRVLEAVSDS